MSGAYGQMEALISSMGKLNASSAEAAAAADIPAPDAPTVVAPVALPVTKAPEAVKAPDALPVTKAPVAPVVKAKDPVQAKEAGKPAAAAAAGAEAEKKADEDVTKKTKEATDAKAAE